MQPPDGFLLRRLGSDRLLLCRSDRLDVALAAGLASADGWRALLSGARAERAGRGSIARVELPEGSTMLLKKLRRGGLLAKLRGERFWGSRRLLRNLSVPLEAIRRGLATPQPLLLFMQRRGPASYEAWLAVEEIPGATDLRRRLSSADPPSEEELRSVMRLIRAMHDAGIHHPDLNLANLLTRRDSSGWNAFVVDLDRAEVGRGAVRFRRRQRAVRRIERSYAKTFGANGPLGRDGSDLWYRFYAETDADLSRRLTRGRAGGRVWLAIHRLGWLMSRKG